MVKIPWGKACELGGKPDRRHVGVMVERRAETQLFRLRVNGIGNFRAPMTYELRAHCGVAIDVLVAVDVAEAGTLARDDDNGTRATMPAQRDARMKEVGLVQFPEFFAARLGCYRSVWHCTHSERSIVLEPAPG